MFKSNPNGNQYYGLIHQMKNKNKRLKRTQFSGERLVLSKKSFSQSSQSDGQINPYTNNLNFQALLNKVPNSSHKIINHKSTPHEISAGQNFLDQFKIFTPVKEDDIKKNIHPIKPVSKKFMGIDSEDQQNSNIATKIYKNKYELGEYFGDSMDVRQYKQEKNGSKSKSHKSRNQKSPLRRILKSKSRQQLYSPVQKMYNIIRLEQKQKEHRYQNQKTLKQINYMRASNQLNQTHEIQLKLKQSSSYKNLFELQSEYKKGNPQPKNFINKNYALQNQNNKSSINKKKLKHQQYHKDIHKVKSQQLITSSHSKQHKINSSIVKKYFNKKQEIERNRQKMKNIIRNIQVSNHIEQNIRKVQTEKKLYSNQSYFEDSSKISNSIVSNQNSQNMIYTEKKGRYFQQKSQKNIPPSFLQYYDYGLQKPQTPQKSISSNKQFRKTLKKSPLQDSQIPNSQTGQRIDTIKSFQSGKSNEISQQGESASRFKSAASIEDLMLEKNSNQKEGNQYDSKLSINRKKSKRNVKSPAQKYYKHQEVSINTPAYHYKKQKDKKQSIMNKLKKDIQADKLKGSRSSKVLIDQNVKQRQKSSNYLNSQSQISKNNQNKKNNNQTSNYASNLDYLKCPNQSKIHDLSNLINSSSPSNQLKANDQSKQVNSKANSMINSKSKLKNVQNVSSYDLQQFKNRQSQQKSSLQSQKISKLSSMINSNSLSIQKQNSQASIILSINQTQNKEKQTIQDKKIVKTLKFIRIVKKESDKKPVPVPKLQQSNLDSLTDSNPAFTQSGGNNASNGNFQQSIQSSQASPLSSSNSLSQFINKDNTKQAIIKVHIPKNNPIEQEQISQCQSQPYDQSENLSDSKSSAQQQSVSNNKISNKQKQSAYSESSASVTISKSKNRASKLFLSQDNLNLNQKPTFSQNNSIQSNSRSSSKMISSSNKLSNTFQKNDSLLFKKKKNFAEYTLNDVARYIQEHQFRIQSFCLYIQNCKLVYQEDYQLQKIQFLSFLMLKKNLFQIQRAIEALQRKNSNVFSLTDIQISNSVLQDYIERQQIQQQLANLVKQESQKKIQLTKMYKSLEKRYAGEKCFSLSLQKDDFSGQIINKLGIQLRNLYEKWLNNSKNNNDLIVQANINKKYQRRMTEIMELIFLISELDGKKVKPCQLIPQTQYQQFKLYYDKWYQIFLQTIQYFDSKSKYSN